MSFRRAAQNRAALHTMIPWRHCAVPERKGGMPDGKGKAEPRGGHPFRGILRGGRQKIYRNPSFFGKDGDRQNRGGNGARTGGQRRGV